MFRVPRLDLLEEFVLPLAAARRRYVAVKGPFGVLEQAPLPRVDLAWVVAEPLGQLWNRVLFANGSQGYLRFERRAVFGTHHLHRILLLGVGLAPHSTLSRGPKYGDQVWVQ
jgi:hypothetical protein